MLSLSHDSSAGLILFEEDSQIRALFTAANKIEREQGCFSSVVCFAVGKSPCFSALQGMLKAVKTRDVVVEAEINFGVVFVREREGGKGIWLHGQGNGGGAPRSESS